MSHAVLAIYPEATCTRIALYRGEHELLSQRVYHEVTELADCGSIAGQWRYRSEALERLIRATDVLDSCRLEALIAPGGILERVPSGVYRTDEMLLQHAQRSEAPQHPSNLGPLLVDALAQKRSIPAFIADPLSSDEANPLSKITGLPELPLVQFAPTLNIKAAVSAAARDLEKPVRELSAVVAHLGKRFSICAYKKGRMVDISSSSEQGPFSPVSCGKIPSRSIVRMAYSGAWSKKTLSGEIRKKGGLLAWLGTKELAEVRERILNGDDRATQVYRAMAYAVASEIAAQATVLGGEIDAIIMTGGCAKDPHFLALIQKRVQWIAPVLNYPNEDDLKALAFSALRVLRGEEPARDYKETVQANG